ncbi:MAG: BsaA family SipW-dependent biofilm matrix protein [Clostridia bacterium]|nr:BsaA family SipW-dependent biofilm matrix protein [Clostridia bacterium]
MKKSQEKKKKKMRLLAATLGVSALIVGGLTFAWYSSTDSVTNTFQANGTFKTVVVENFTPPTNWEPGTTTDKVVQVTNTGTIDAYTRVWLEPRISFDIKQKNGDNYVTTDLDSVDASGTYATVNSSAIDAASAGFTKYDGNSSSPLGAVPSNVTLYVKESTGTTDYSSSTAGETKKYEFLGYYSVTGQNVDGSDETTAYELCITVDNSALRAAGYDYSDNAGFITVTDATGNTYQSVLKYALYNAEHKDSTVETSIDPYDYVTLNFYNSDDPTAADDTYWYESTDSTGRVYYYYRNKLVSGATTQPLLDSVTFKDSIDMSDISNLVFDLDVNNISTQAIMEAGIQTFGKDDSNIDEADLTNANTFATIIATADQNWQSDFSDTNP